MHHLSLTTNIQGTVPADYFLTTFIPSFSAFSVFFTRSQKQKEIPEPFNS